MRVAIDARRLQDRPLTGVGRWLSHVVGGLSPATDAVLLTDARRPPADSDRPQVALRVPPKAPEVVWLELAAGPWLRSFDGVFHGSFNAVPFIRAARSVVSIYDVSFEHHPEDLGPAKRALFRVQARHAAATARVVLTVSEFSRQAIVETYRVPPERVVVVPPSVDPVFAPSRRPHAPDLVASIGVRGRYVVAIGGARRRGLEVALGAWRAVRDESGPHLVVVGPEAPPAEAGVVFAGPLDDASWATVLAGAEAFCFPTRYEGFGLPALEAAASGVPVVCAPVASLPEVLGDAAEWCERPAVEAIARGLRRVLSDGERRQELSRRGLACAERAAGRGVAAAALVERAYGIAAGGRS